MRTNYSITNTQILFIVVKPLVTHKADAAKFLRKINCSSKNCGVGERVRKM